MTKKEILKTIRKIDRELVDLDSLYTAEVIKLQSGLDGISIKAEAMRQKLTRKLWKTQKRIIDLSNALDREVGFEEE